MITVKFADKQVLSTFQRIEERGLHLSPLFKNIGEYLVNSSQDHFRTSTAPDGSKWAPNAQSTYLAILGKSHSGKSGKLNVRGVNRILSKRPLILTGDLMNDIHYQLVADGLEVGTNKIYAATQQFGAKKGEFGIMPKKNHEIPFGNIPAREFLGISNQDEGAILFMAIEHLAIGKD